MSTRDSLGFLITSTASEDRPTPRADCSACRICTDWYARDATIDYYYAITRAKGRYYEWVLIRDACLGVWMDYYTWKQWATRQHEWTTIHDLLTPSMKSVVLRLRKNVRIVNKSEYPLTSRYNGVRRWLTKPQPPMNWPGVVTQLYGRQKLARQDRSLQVVGQEVLTRGDKERREDENLFGVILVMLF